MANHLTCKKVKIETTFAGQVGDGSFYELYLRR